MLHFKLNSMKKERSGLSLENEKKLKSFLWADNKLYAFFRKRLRKQIAHYGREKVERIKAQIIEQSGLLEEECMEGWLRIWYNDVR